MKTEYQTILYSIENNIAKIILNRPEANNSINLQLAKDLMTVTMRCSEDPEIRAIIITGQGKAFCPGGDLKSFAEEKENLPYLLKDITTHLHAAVSRLTRMDPPSIVAVNGIAAGAGMSLACGGDIVLAAESARFTMAYTRIGLSPDGGASYFLPRIVGLRQAIDLTLTNRLLTADEARDMGIVTRVVPDDELMAQAEDLAATLSASSTKALGAAKRLMYSGFTETLETQLEDESQSLSNMARTPEAQEAIAGFLKKRK